MLTFACVLKSGGVYDDQWVGKLAAGVRNHISVPHRFVCLSDVPVPVEWIPLEHGWPGWWSKLELFRPGLLTGPTIYLDLDTIVTGDVSALESEDLAMVPDWLRPGRFCSTAMAWRGDKSHIWRAFAAEPERMMSLFRAPGDGDQAFIEEQIGTRDVQPLKGVASYREQSLCGPPGWAVAVAFHGRPKPPEAGSWASEAWGAL